MLATRSIPAGTFILQLSGVASDEDVPATVAKFSVIQRKQRAGSVDALLVGPIRFINHCCKPNCKVRGRSWHKLLNNVLPWSQIFPMVDHCDGLRHSACYLVQTLMPVAPDQEITIHYGDGYFTSSNTCACPHCAPKTTLQTLVEGTPSSSDDAQATSDVDEEAWQGGQRVQGDSKRRKRVGRRGPKRIRLDK